MADPIVKQEVTSETGKLAPSSSPQPSPGKPLPEDVKASIESGRQQLSRMREEMGSPPPVQTPEANAVKPAQAPSTQPAAAPAVTPLGQPVQPIVQPAQPQPAAAPAADKKSVAEFQSNVQKEAKSSGTFELFGKALAALAGLLESFKGFDISRMLGISEAKTAEKKSTGEKYTEEQLKQMALDLTKNKDKVYPSHDKAVEYIAAVLNLPVRETAQKFLDSLTDSGMVFDQSMDNMKNLEPGDILFFKKTDEKGAVFAYTCAVVTSKEPLKMSIVPDGGGAPTEVTVLESDYFKNSWYGFIKTKKYGTESKS